MAESAVAWLEKLIAWLGASRPWPPAQNSRLFTAFGVFSRLSGLAGGMRRRNQTLQQNQQQQVAAQSAAGSQQSQQRNAYNRAMAACLTGRGYIVN
jgi:hypothetical protein